jgi:6-phosphogluconolactonase
MKYIAYIGTYAGGIHTFNFDPSSGRLTQAQPVARLDNPSWLIASADGRFLYAALETETFEGVPGGGVCALAIDRESGALAKLNAQPTHGAAPCHLCMDAAGRFLFAANYTSGSVSAFPLNADGAVGPLAQLIQHFGSGPVADRQEGPHAHFVTLTPDGHFLCAVDFGADSAFVYRIDDRTGALSPDGNLTVRLRPGSGPRHMAFHPNGKFAYVLTELSCQVAVYNFSPSPFGFSELQAVSALPAGYSGVNLSAAVHISPDGRTLYAANRGHDSIAVFSIDEATGRLALLQHVPAQGRCPREFIIDPTGRFLFAANQNSDTVAAFSIERGSGRLAPNGQVVEVPRPACVKIVRLQPEGGQSQNRTARLIY